MFLFSLAADYINLSVFASENNDGGKRHFPLLLCQSQPRQQLLPRQPAEDGGFPRPLLHPLPALPVPQRRGCVGLLRHPLQIPLHHIPEEHCRCRCCHDAHLPFQGFNFSLEQIDR